MKDDKKKITEKVMDIYAGISLSDIIKQTEHDTYDDLRIEYDYSRGYYDSVDIDVWIMGDRLETDEEYNKRLDKQRKYEEKKEEREKKNKEKAKRARERKEQKEKELFEKLKKKYGS